MRGSLGRGSNMGADVETGRFSGNATYGRNKFDQPPPSMGRRPDAMESQDRRGERFQNGQENYEERNGNNFGNRGIFSRRNEEGQKSDFGTGNASFDNRGDYTADGSAGRHYGNRGDGPPGANFGRDGDPRASNEGERGSYSGSQSRRGNFGLSGDRGDGPPGANFGRDGDPRGSNEGERGSYSGSQSYRGNFGLSGGRGGYSSRGREDRSNDGGFTGPTNYPGQTGIGNRGANADDGQRRDNFSTFNSNGGARLYRNPGNDDRDVDRGNSRVGNQEGRNINDMAGSGGIPRWLNDSARFNQGGNTEFARAGGYGRGIALANASGRGGQNNSFGAGIFRGKDNCGPGVGFSRNSVSYSRSNAAHGQWDGGEERGRNHGGGQNEFRGGNEHFGSRGFGGYQGRNAQEDNSHRSSYRAGQEESSQGVAQENRSFGSRGFGASEGTSRFENRNRFPRDDGGADTSGARGSSFSQDANGGSTFGNRKNDFSEDHERGGGGAFGSHSFRSREAGVNDGDGRGVPGRRMFGTAGNLDENAESRPPPSTYIPEERTLEELYKDDADNFEKMDRIDDLDQPVEVKGHNVDVRMTQLENWENVGFEELLARNLAKCQYVCPRRIQSAVIPLVMNKYDVLGHAETGSGKTAAFVLPIIDDIMKNPSRGENSHCAPIALVVAPTRELVLQLFDHARKLTQGTGVTVAKAYGQYSTFANFTEIQRGCDLLFATAGRLMDFVGKGKIKLHRIRYFVLDEADQMLDDGHFANEMNELAARADFPKTDRRQTLMFSATFSDEVQSLAKDLLKREYVFVSNGKVKAANVHVEQHFVEVTKPGYDSKMEKLLEIIGSDKDTYGDIRRTLVFVTKKSATDIVAMYLCQHQVTASSIHGGREQKEREKALNEFRRGQIKVLVATDVCARGIDVANLDHVVNFDLPNQSITYVHRIGRTGRLRRGTATSFVNLSDPYDQKLVPDLIQIVRDVQQEVPKFMLEYMGGSSFRSYDPSSSSGAFSTASTGGFGKTNLTGGFGQGGFSSRASDPKTGMGQDNKKRADAEAENEGWQ